MVGFSNFIFCTRLTINRRTLSKKEKKSYISAIHCLASKPNVIPKDVAPGAVSLYDSLVATHTIAFPDVHWTVLIPFLSLDIIIYLLLT